MRLNRMLILSSLASLTVIFLAGAAAFAFVGEIQLFNADTAALKTRPFPKDDTPGVMRLTIRESGITAVSAQQIRAANIPFLTLSADEISLTRDGMAVPFYVHTYNSQPALYFYAQAVTTTMEAPAVYLLTRGTGTPMAREHAAPTGPGNQMAMQHHHWEENNSLLTHTNGDDVWLGPLLLAPDEWQLSLTDIAPSGGPGELTIRVWSSTRGEMQPDHHLEISLNGRILTNWYWDGVKQETISVPLQPQDLSANEPNYLTLKSPGDTGAAGEAVYIDWIKLFYETAVNVANGQAAFSSASNNITVQTATSDLLVFDVTDPQDPAILQDIAQQDGQATFAGTGEHYIALLPSQAHKPAISVAPVWKVPLRQAERGADYIAIVADEEGFSQALEPLLTYRQEQGYRVTAVSLNQIYDEFGFGQQSAAAIRRFLEYASENWQPPAPQYVLLVGDASVDRPGQSSSANLLPTSLVRISYNGFIASDTWFALNENGIPQMAIGRFPAQTAVQLKAMVQKTLTYENSAASNYWSGGALLVADDDEPEFDVISDSLASILAENGFQIHDLHMAENDNIRYEVMSAINQGVGILNYVGHGSERVWGDEFVFGGDDVRLLKNQYRLPVFTTFTCSNGAFAQPQTPSLAEELLWAENGGAAAVIAPSGRMLTADTSSIAEPFYRSLFRDGIETLGEALLAAKTAPTGNIHDEDILHLINLLGDPALRVHKP